MSKPMNEDDLMRDVSELINSWQRRGVSADLHVRLVFTCSTDPTMNETLLARDPNEPWHPATLLASAVSTGDQAWKTKTRRLDTWWPAGEGPAGVAVTGPVEEKRELVGEFTSLEEARRASDERFASAAQSQGTKKKPPSA